MFVLGVGPGAQADESRSVRMTYSGTNCNDNQPAPNTVTDETHLIGNGSLGAFTFRELADGASPQPPVGCSGPNFAVVAGAGVFTFEDGSLLVVTVADGSACIDLAAGNAAITVNYQISGGTGRFREASGELRMSGTLMVVLLDASNAPVLLTNTGRIKGTIFGVKHWE